MHSIQMVASTSGVSVAKTRICQHSETFPRDSKRDYFDFDQRWIFAGRENGASAFAPRASLSSQADQASFLVCTIKKVGE
jgi:hypothetical protein